MNVPPLLNTLYKKVVPSSRCHSAAARRKEVFYRRAGRPVVVVSFPRSGTHLTLDLLRRQFEVCDSWKWFGERNDSLYVDLDRLLPTHFDSASGRDCSPLSEGKALDRLLRTQRPLIKTHAFPDFLVHRRWRQAWVEWLTDRADVIYVVRDGREVACSLQLMASDQSDAADTSVGTFLRQERAWFLPEAARGRSVARLWAEHVRTWRDQPGVQVLRFDEVLERPERALAHLADRVGEPPRRQHPLLPPHPKSKWQGRFDRLFRMCPSSTALLTRSTQHERQEWERALTKRDRRFFRDETNGLLEEMGFVDSPAWIHGNS